MIYVIGGSNMDIYGQAKNKLIDHDSNIGQIRLVHGGVGRNIVESLARLALPVNFMTIFGRDTFGEALRNQLLLLGVNLEHSHFSKQMTATYMAILNDSGDMHMAICDNEIINELSKEKIADYIDHVTSSDFLVMDANLEEELICLMRRSQGLVFADPLSVAKARKLRSCLDCIYAFKPNIYEAQELWGKEIRNEQDLYDAGTFFLERGIQHIYLSLGEKGMYYRSREESWLITTPVCSMVNASGAGDGCMAGIVYGHSLGLPYRELVEFAMSNAILALQSMDTVPSDLSVEKVKEVQRNVNFEWRKLEC